MAKVSPPSSIIVVEVADERVEHLKSQGWVHHEAVKPAEDKPKRRTTKSE
jgi:hypothetical protein